MVLLHEIAGTKTIVQGADNTQAVNERLARCPANTLVTVRGTVTHDGTIILKQKTNVRLIPEKLGNGFQTLTDTGGLEPTKARIRVHLLIDRCVDSGPCDFLDIGGTHPEGGPNSSPDVSTDPEVTRDIWEGQPGVRIQGSKGSVVRANIHHVWGDFVELDAAIPRAGEYYANESTLILGGKWHRNGRVGVKAHANKGLQWYDTEVSKCVGEKFHVESGSNPLSNQSDLFMQRIVTDGFGRSLVGCSGGSRIDGLYVGDIIQTAGCAQVNISGPTRDTAGNAKYTRFRFFNWHWPDPEDGGVIAAFRNVDSLEYGVNCVGPVRKTVQQSLQFRVNDCRDAHIDLSGIRRV